MRLSRYGVNLEDVQEMNRALVIRLMRKAKVCSRADLAKLSGLRQATITNIVNDLRKWELVTETGVIDGQKGRRSIGITLNTELYKVIGVRLARHHFSVGLFDLFGSGEELDRQAIDAIEGSGQAFDRIKTAVGRLMAASSRYRILGIGMAIPGPFFRTEGRIALMTEFPGWEQVQLEEELRTAFRLPVYLEHDANAGALAEWWLGRHTREVGTIVYVAAGQGVGAGIVIDGRLFRGSLGIAGEIGHMSIDYDGPRCECGNNGCLEHYCSTIAVMRDAAAELVNFPQSAIRADQSLGALIAAARDGDALARHVLTKAARFLGFGLVNIVNVYNPDVIIIGDELAEAGPLLLDVVQDTVRSHVLPSVYGRLTIELSSFAADPAIIGVSTLVVEKVLHRPSAIEELAVNGRYVEAHAGDGP